jgi:hypothetical protein
VLHTKGAHKRNNDSSTTPIFIGINKATQKHRRRRKKTARERIKSYVLKQMYFSVNDENATALKYFDLRISAVA